MATPKVEMRLPPGLVERIDRLAFERNPQKPNRTEVVIDALNAYLGGPAVRYHCRVCDFTAASPNAKCPHHAGKLLAG